jgi:uncharacterized protein (DUF58 family)
MKPAIALERLPDSIARRLGRRKPDILPLTLSQSRVYVLPTRAGLAFALALVIMLIGAINYSLSLGYALVFLLFGLGIAGTVHAFRNLVTLSVNRASLEPVFAGEPAILRLQLENPSTRRRAALRVRAGEHEESVDLDPREVAQVEVPLPTERRGWLPVGRIVVATTWPLGLARAWSVLRPDLAGLVYAAPERTPPPLPGGFGDAEGRRAPVDGDDDFAGLRAHRITDSPRHVAWKAVAGGGPMLTKEFSALEAAAIELGWHDAADAPDDDTRAARLTAWALIAERRGLRYALNTPDGFLAPGRGQTHLQLCLARLALARSRDAKPR